MRPLDCGLSEESLLWTDFSAQCETSAGFQRPPLFPPGCLGAAKVLAVTWIQMGNTTSGHIAPYFEAKPLIFKES